MKTHNVTQGSQEWLDLRKTAFTASDASAMMGASKYERRSDLLARYKTGITPEITPIQQRIFDEGHAQEAIARPIVESIIGEELYPVTGSIEIDGMTLLASFDGLTMAEDVGFEHKLLNDNLRDMMQSGEVTDMHYVWQLEQQVLVSGAQYIMFTASRGDEMPTPIKYVSQPERREQLIAGWKQFAADLENWTQPESQVMTLGKTPDSLPSLMIQVTGAVTSSNLAQFKAVATNVIQAIKTELVTDQDFADAEKTVKWCSDAEAAITAAKEQALQQTVSIAELFKTLDSVKEQLRETRLKLDKSVKSQKEDRKRLIVLYAQTAMNGYIRTLEVAQYMPKPNVDFASAITGKKNLDIMKKAVDEKLAEAKVAASLLAKRISQNLAYLTNHEDHKFLFSTDLHALVQKEPDDLRSIIRGRISVYDADQKVKAEKAAAEKAAAERAEQIAQAPKANHATPATKPAVATVVVTGEHITLQAAINELNLTPSEELLSHLGFGEVEYFTRYEFNQLCDGLVNHIQDVRRMVNLEAEAAQTAA